MKTENKEGFKEFNIPGDWHQHRRVGISAMLRVRNEAEFLARSVASIIDAVDEVVICVQGGQDDNTAEVAIRIMGARPDKVAVFFYPFESVPNGPGHGECDPSSVHARSYFYNWALSKTTRSHVIKWDGDMVAFEGLRFPRPEDSVFDVDAWEINGWDLIRHNGGWWLGAREKCATEPRLFRVTAETFYVNGPMCEVLRLPKSFRRMNGGTVFLHFKWAKPLEKATQAWPDGWQDVPHFQRIVGRSKPVKPYSGGWPRVLADMAGEVAGNA